MKIVDLGIDVIRHPAFPPGVRPALNVAIVRVFTDEGIVGIGEASSTPEVVRAAIDARTLDVLSHAVREVLVGRDPREVGTLWEDLYRLTLYPGHRGAYLHAISAIDIALWDILGKATGLPVYMLLGGAFQHEIPVYGTYPLPDTPQAVTALVERAAAAGWGAVKLGWLPHPSSQRRDVELVHAARAAIGSDAPLMIDIGPRWQRIEGLPRAVRPWDAKTALRRITAWAEADLDWVEEPLPPDDIDGYQRLAHAVTTPIAAGEQETSRFAVKNLIDAGVDVVQCDVGRVGGLTEGRRVAQAAADHNRAFAPHCYGTDLQLVASAHLAAAAPTLARMEYPAQLAAQAIIHPRPKPTKDTLPVPHGPGLGIELDTELVKHLSIAAAGEAPYEQ
jgi:L-alanine-DL-glutamate epimerase-like enolase superfamily enzyme